MPAQVVAAVLFVAARHDPDCRSSTPVLLEDGMAMTKSDSNQAAASGRTRASLLLRVRDPNDGHAWQEFVGVYGPLIYSYARHRGLQDADAADLTQEVLGAVAEAMPRFQYDKNLGRFRGWLFNATRNRMINLADRAKRVPQASGRSDVVELLHAIPDAGNADTEFDRQHDWQLFLTAANRVRERFTDATWQAFWSNVVEQEAAADVAARVGITVGAVYIAKSRVMNAVRDEVACLCEL